MVNTVYVGIIVMTLIVLIVVFEYMRTKCKKYRVSAAKAKAAYYNSQKANKTLKMQLDHLNALVGTDTKSGCEMYVYPQLYIVDYYSQKVYKVDNYQLPNSSIAFGTTDKNIWKFDDTTGTASITDPEKLDINPTNDKKEK